MEIILASQSQSIKALLKLVLSSFRVEVAAIDETTLKDEAPLAYVKRMAYEKAAKVAQFHPQSLVIGSDTSVVIDQQILGKPNNRQAAKVMLQKLSQATHEVHTAVCIIQSGVAKTFVSSATVTFSKLTDQEIEAYLDLNEYQDKAGAYGIQGEAAKFIEKIDGDYYAIVGLPVNKLYQELKSIIHS